MRPSEARWKATAVYHRTCLDDDRVNGRARNYVTFGARPNVGVLRLLSKQLRIDRFTDADGVGDHHPPAGAAWRGEHRSERVTQTYLRRGRLAMPSPSSRRCGLTPSSPTWRCRVKMASGWSINYADCR